MTLLVGHPEPGTYRTRLIKHGPWVPVRIFRACACTIGGEILHDWSPRCDRYPPIRALVDGQEWWAPLDIWNRCRPISEAEYRYLVAVAEHARDHDPGAPEAKPRRAVNLGEMPPIF